MKLLRFLLLPLITFILATNLHAQDEYHPWQFGASVNIVDYYPFNDKTTYTSGNELDERISHFNYGIPTIHISKYIGDGFSFGVAGSYNTIDNYDGLPVNDLDYISVDGLIKYDINKLIGKTGFLDPYATIGGGYFLMGDDYGTGTFNAGVGTNLWFSNNWGINLDSKYKHSFETIRYEINQHFLHSAGLVYRFGSSDRDGDGIINSKDDCPKRFGLKELNGCPDKDNDKVADDKDACPEIPGIFELNGCPDEDEDGIADKDDKCPKSKGIEKHEGCPDSDGDGVIDNKDNCPDITGPKENNGCPYGDSDMDGVLDNEDSCVNDPGPPSNNGCPKLIGNDEVSILEGLFKTVYFESGKDTFTEETIGILNDAFNMLRKYMYSDFNIEGYTDNVGFWEMNLDLSKRRADAIKNYFTNRGIDGTHLTSTGYGENRPIASNATAAGRAKNRRVEIKVTIEDKVE
jgi:outer membrane protein OmpA-like peptidoglycan-associated protein